MTDQAEAIRTYVRKHSIGLSLNDSVALLCNGEPEKADQARIFFQGLHYIEIGSLNIAHITLEAGKTPVQKKPFGSSFWHNSARVTWNAQKAQEEGSRVLNIGMHNRKNNDDELMRPFGLTVAFDGRRGPISVTRNDINEVPDLAQGLSLKSRLLYSLKSGPRQLDDLAEELFPDAVDKKDLDRARTQVRARLNDLAKSGSAQKWVAGKWTLTSDREEESS